MSPVPRMSSTRSRVTRIEPAEARLFLYRLSAGLQDAMFASRML